MAIDGAISTSTSRPSATCPASTSCPKRRSAEAHVEAWGCHNRWLTVITVDPVEFGSDREAIRLALEAENIEARPRPAGTRKPMHLQPIFTGCETVGGSVAESLFRDGLCFPSGSNLSEGDLARVVAGIRSV